MVVHTDYSLAGQKLTISTEIAGVVLSGKLLGGGYGKLEFPMPPLPSAGEEPCPSLVDFLYFLFGNCQIAPSPPCEGGAPLRSSIAP